MAHTRAPLATVSTAALCAATMLLAGCGGGSSRTTATAARDPARQVSSVAAGPPVTVASASSGRARTVAIYGRRGNGAGELAEPFGIAVDHRSGDFYVVDSNNERVTKWTSAGRFVRAWGWGVADGRTRALQTCTRKCFAGLRGVGAAQFDFAEGVAVDNEPGSRSRGDVYVAVLHGGGRVDKFSPDGRFLLTFGGGVNHTARAHGDRADEDVCPVRPGDVCGKSTDGSTGGQLEISVEGSFVAVGPHGTVYVGQRNSVKTFSPDGRYLSRIPLTPPPITSEGREAGGVSQVAVDRSGILYVVRHEVVGVDVYAPSGKLVRTLEAGGVPTYDEGPTPALALDPDGNLFVDVYADERHRIDEYTPSGVRIASFDRGPKSPPWIADKEDGLPGMAYNPRTKLLYVVNADVNVKPIVSDVRAIAPPRP
jgi:hypothetical protein